MRHAPRLSATMEERSYSPFASTAEYMLCRLILTSRAIKSTKPKPYITQIHKPYIMKNEHIHTFNIFYAAQITNSAQTQM